MEIKEVTTCRVDEYLSPANNIPDDHNLIQKDTMEAICEQKQIRHDIDNNVPVDWSRYDKAHGVMARAHKHYPGERGSMNITPTSNARRRT